jgi:predicted NACHT family NTPase
LHYQALFLTIYCNSILQNMIADINAALIKAGSSNLAQIVLSLKRFIKDEVKIHNATVEYANSYIDRYGSVKILGMREPTSLLNLYTEVEIVNAENKVKIHSLETLEKEFRESRSHHKFAQSREYGIHVANNKQKLNVLGAPGSGKSTFLRHIGLECLTNNTFPKKEVFKHKCFPVLIELKRFRNEQINLKALIQKELEIAGFPKTDTLLDRLLSSGSLLLLLDGLDEVPEANLTIVLEHINDFTNRYKQNRFVTSCRTAHYKSYLKGFTDIEISDFSNDQITQFTQNWFTSEDDMQANTASRLQEQLFFDHNSATLELARTPLLLTFICLTFDDGQRFPTNRASLYREALMILMKRWAAEKRIQSDDIYQKFTIELETELLAEIAASYFKDDRIFFTEEDINSKIKIYLEDRRLGEDIHIGKVLEAIEKQQGLLVLRSYDIYSFSHLTIQEYLTAHYYRSPKQTDYLIRSHLFDTRWREVVLLLSNSGDANDFLLMMNDYLAEYARNQKLLSDVLDWIKAIKLNEDDTKRLSVYRVFLASLIVRFKRYQENYPQKADRLEPYANNLIDALDPAYYNFFIRDLNTNFTKKTGKNLLIEVARIIPKVDVPATIENMMSIAPERKLSEMLEGGRHAYRKQMQKVLYDAIKIPETLYTKSRPAYSPILNYMQAYTLILECAENSETVKQTTLTKIYKSIFN